MTANDLRNRRAPLEMSPEAFREAGHRLVDGIAAFLESLPGRPVSPGRDAERAAGLLPAALGRGGRASGPARRGGRPSSSTTRSSTGTRGSSATSPPRPLRSGRSRTCWRPRSTPTWAGGSSRRSPPRSRASRVRWMASLLGMPAGTEGLLVSGGNMANFVCFLAARRAKAGGDVREAGVHRDGPRLLAYASTETHTWIQKAADLFGHGTDSLRWIPVRDDLTIDVSGPRAPDRGGPPRGAPAVPPRRERGHREHRRRRPAGPAGRDRTRARPVVPRRRGLRRPRGGERRGSPDLAGLAEADSVAFDPHKWLYSALEAGCALVRHPGGCATPSATRPRTTASTARRRTRARTTSSSASRTREASAP